MKINNTIHIKSEASQLEKSIPADRLFVYNGKCRKCIPTNTIVMIQSFSNYSTIYLISGDQILTSRTLKYWANLLGHTNMLRTHQSFLINVESIVSIENRRVQLKNNLEARISRNIPVRTVMNQILAKPA